ncbi:hypothetical protein BKG77_09985 [Mycobacteroides chelonae]|nr:hypothetical protein BKG77_09985 [Mycobacteroides chelonae]
MAECEVPQGGWWSRASRLRPARKFVLGQGAAAIVLAAVTLPASYPTAGEAPLWVQLVGLVFLLASVGASLLTWRHVVIGELRQPQLTQKLGGHGMLRQRVRDERQMRVSAIVCPATMFVLVPLPPSWEWFWFGVTVLGAIIGAVSLARLLRSEIADR